MSAVKSRIAKRPWWAKQRESCPSCGHVFFWREEHLLESRQFKCPQCGVEMSMVDFWKFHHDKYSKAADLSGETEIEFDE